MISDSFDEENHTAFVNTLEELKIEYAVEILVNHRGWLLPRLMEEG